MTPAQIAHIMSLVTELCADCARAYCEQLYGTSETYTKLCCEKADKSRAAVEVALRDAPQAEGWVMVPVKATPEMCKAAYGYSDNGNRWSAMPSSHTAIFPSFCFICCHAKRTSRARLSCSRAMGRTK